MHQQNSGRQDYKLIQRSMPIRYRRFFYWPTLPDLLSMLGLSMIFMVAFFAVFSATDFITKQHHIRIAGGLDFEDRIPFFPALITVYFSGSVMLFLSPWMLHRKAQFIPFFKVMLLELLIAGLFFLLVPFTLMSRPLIPATGFISSLFYLCDLANLDYNYFPSLHVAFAFTLAFFVAEEKTNWQKVICLTWASAVALSTLLTKQHYLLDVAGGLILSVICYRLRKKVR